ncbi:hypothetical protein BB559_002242 [Furculomyces boomerangus]|uniref:Phosphoacetylglucosamine mutase n=2 Tax=Harpellales TaxID=61421 RepID=A0A2T9YBA8_9FUNG|nr:hypothetical protein BB559_005018 [Furculomyces boomerangus]PVU96794.1 hypothetical protein BB559_002242 [Furculomyces boomerangus]PVZ98144.1 hypothetical protein BB558_005875 [Smittium angustum]
MDSLFDRISEASKSYPKPNIHFSYGTAGFRTIGLDLVSTVFRMGIISALRSQKKFGKAIGVMITASHNKEEDNGIKLVDPMGEMLNQSWEEYCTTVANAKDEQELISAIKDIVNRENIDITKPANVLYGYDTRPTSVLLVGALENGLKAINAESVNYGVVTTPQLHYFVRCVNTKDYVPYGEPSVDGYNKKFAKAYITLMDMARVTPDTITSVNIDCANGVGAPQMAKIASVIGDNYLKANLLNTEVYVKNKLNHDCGADFVKSNQKPPESVPIIPGQRYCSFDGDADRVIYYYFDQNKQFRLLDGDKISSLIAMYLRDLVNTAGLTELNLGVVQTAYANGSSTKYMRNTLQLPVVMANTGVKYLHSEAEKFDIGVYFEANGHGSILFSDKAVDVLKNKEPQSPAQMDAMVKLAAFRNLVNEAVGDAISDMLLVEVILASKRWSLVHWDQSYTLVPNRLMKVKVSNRHVFTTTNAEQTLVTPAGVQDLIDNVVSKYPNGRSFVRPSGTEDAVRIFSEANTPENAEELGITVCRIVYDKAGGIGPYP